jgi:mRNA interferase HigB
LSTPGALRAVKHFVDSGPKYSDAREPALAGTEQALIADWASLAEVKRDIGSASVLKDGRVVFNLGGNKYRIVVWIDYPTSSMSGSLVYTANKIESMRRPFKEARQCNGHQANQDQTRLRSGAQGDRAVNVGKTQYA